MKDAAVNPTASPRRYAIEPRPRIGPFPRRRRTDAAAPTRNPLGVDCRAQSLAAHASSRGRLGLRLDPGLGRLAGRPECPHDLIADDEAPDDRARPAKYARA